MSAAKRHPAFAKYSENADESRQIDQLMKSGGLTPYLLFYPRLIYDISLLRFLQYYGIHFGHKLLGSDESIRKEIAQNAWPQYPERVVTSLSVRTFFDCYFRAAELPKGSEILFSGMSIPQMKRIAEFHGMVIKAFDIDLVTFQPDVEQARSLINDKTRLIIVAPCYGTHMLRMQELQALAKEKNVPFMLDLAQAWGVMDRYRDLDADVTAISFGSIKYQTALGGCVATVKDAALREKINQVEASLPVRTWSSQLGVIVKNSAAVFLASDAATTATVRNTCGLFGLEWTDLVNKASRGFPGPNLIELIRRRPHRSLLKMLAIRLGEDKARNRAKMRLRIVSGWDILSRLPNYVQIVGGGDPNEPENSTFWLFPLYCKDAIACDKLFHANGIDSALGTSQMCSMGGGVVSHESDGKATAPTSTTPICDKFMQHILYLPSYPQLGERGRDTLLKVIHAMPRRMIETPDEHFHAFVASNPFKHAYRSKAVAEMLKDRPLFSEHAPRLLVAGAMTGAAFTTAPSQVGFALRSML